MFYNNVLFFDETANFQIVLAQFKNTKKMYFLRGVYSLRLGITVNSLRRKTFSFFFFSKYVVPFTNTVSLLIVIVVCLVWINLKNSRLKTRSCLRLSN